MVNSNTLLAVFILILVLELVCSMGVCHPKDQCSCISDDGLMINLRPIDQKGTPLFGKISGRLGDAYVYSYNPCSPFTKAGVAGECKDVLSCRSKATGLEPVAMAYPNKPLVNYDESEEIYTFTYTGGHLPKGDVRKLVIKLKCEAKATIPRIGSFLPANESTYITTLATKYACPERYTSYLSTEVAVCLLFALLTSAFWLLGMMYNKFVKGENGTDVIPLKQCWVRLRHSFKVREVSYGVLGEKVDDC